MDRLKKVNTLDGSEVLENSKFFVEEFHDTGIPALNIAMSGRPDGGYSKGSTLIGGESATFKSLFCLHMAKCHLDNFDDALFVFFDVEGGLNLNSFRSMGVDMSRVLHKPFSTIEELIHDIVPLLDELTEKDNVVFMVDSIGAANTKKTTIDAASGKDVTDMTKSKAVKRFWNLVNPQLNIKKLSLYAVAQVYDTMEMYSKKVFAGGKANYYAPNNRWLVTKAKEDKLVAGKKEKIGSRFTINIEKSRLIKEGSKFPITVTFEKGIDKYSSLLEIALDTGHVEKPKVGWYCKKGEEKNWRKADTSCSEFWDSILADPTFSEDILKRYELGGLEGEPVKIDENEGLD